MLAPAIAWTQIAANIATIVAAIVAIITIPLAYHQLRRAESARRLDLIETRIADRYLELKPADQIYDPYEDAVLRDFLRRQEIADLLLLWRRLAGNARANPFIEDVHRKLSSDARRLAQSSEKLLAERQISLASFEGQDMDAIYAQFCDGTGGYGITPSLVQGGRYVVELTEKLRVTLEQSRPK